MVSILLTHEETNSEHLAQDHKQQFRKMSPEHLRAKSSAHPSNDWLWNLLPASFRVFFFLYYLTKGKVRTIRIRPSILKDQVLILLTF